MHGSSIFVSASNAGCYHAHRSLRYFWCTDCGGTSLALQYQTKMRLVSRVKTVSRPAKVQGVDLSRKKMRRRVAERWEDADAAAMFARLSVVVLHQPCAREGLYNSSQAIYLELSSTTPSSIISTYNQSFRFPSSIPSSLPSAGPYALV